MNKTVKALAQKALTRPTSPAELDALADLAREVLGPKRRDKGLSFGRMKPTSKEQKAKTKTVRQAVWERVSHGGTAGRCECGCGRAIYAATFHLDHFFGGSDRDESNTIEGCWALHATCDAKKTLYEPTRAFWIARYGEHCARHRYAGQMAKADKALTLYQAQHPEARNARTGT